MFDAETKKRKRKPWGWKRIAGGVCIALALVARLTSHTNAFSFFLLLGLILVMVELWRDFSY